MGTKRTTRHRESAFFFDEMASEWDLESCSKIIVSLGDFNGHVGKCAEGFERIYRENGIGKRNVEGRRLMECCDEKKLYLVSTWFLKANKRKIFYSAGGCETEIDLCLWGKIQKVYKGCKSDFLGTKAQTCSRRYG